MRVVGWNVRSLRDDAAGVARVLRELDPDVALLQEAPRLLGWRTACRRLARRSGLVVVTGGRPAAGNLLLVRPDVQVHRAQSVLLPRRPGLHRRGAVVGVLQVGGRRLAVLGTHLDLDPDARLASATALREQEPLDAPLVVAADVNEEAGGPAWRVLSGGLVDAGAGLGPTFSVASPRRRLDGVFVDRALEVLRCEQPDPGPVTDHRPVVVDLAWRSG